MVSRDFSLRPTTPITPTGRLTEPQDRVSAPAPENPPAAPPASAPPAAPVDSQTLSRATLSATAELSNTSPEVMADIATVEGNLAGVEVDSEGYAAFTTDTLPALSETERADLSERLTRVDTLVESTAETLLALSTDERHPRAGRRRERQDIPADRAALSSSLQAERDGLNEARARLDPTQDAALIQDLDTQIERLNAADTLVNEAGQLDSARRELLDADFGVDSRGRISLSDEQLQTEMTSRIENLETATTRYEEALAVLAGDSEGTGALSTEQVNGFRELSTRTRQDVRQFRDFVYEPDNNTMDMMQQLGRGGRSLSSRYQNYSGFMRNRVQGNRSGRPNSPTYETFNTRGYVNSLRHDLSDARVFSQRFSRVLGEMERRAPTDNPMGAEELRAEVRSIYSTERGDPFVRGAVIQATTDVGEARRLTQVAQRQIDQASRLLDQAEGSLGEAATAQDASFFDEARLRVAEARDDIDASRSVNGQGRSNLAEARRRNGGSLEALPPSMQQDLGQVQRTTAGNIDAQTARANANDQRADDLSAQADTQVSAIDAAEEQAALERERNNQQINFLIGALETMAAGSEESIQLELGIRAGTSMGNRLGASATARAVVGLTAEKGSGLGGTYTLRANYGFEGELQAQFFGLSGSLEYSRMFSEGVSFYRAEQAQQFAQLTTDFVNSMGDTGIRSSETREAWNALTSYVDQNAYSADTEAITATGRFGNQEIQFQGTRGVHSYTTFQDAVGENGRSNGIRDNGEAEVRENIRETGLRGSFDGRINGQRVGVAVSTTDARLESRTVNGVPERGNNETSNVTTVRLTLPYSVLQNADDRSLEQMLVSAAASVPGSDPQMRMSTDSLREGMRDLRTQARSQSSARSAVVIEYARLRNPDGTVEHALRAGNHRERKTEVALPTPLTGVQVVAGYERTGTTLVNVATWGDNQ